jgi:group I intron endonuclease
MIIYKATNKINGKIYIGQTIKSLHDRSLEHKSDAKRNNYCFPNAIAKYGFENFSWETIESCSSQEQLDEKEVFWIKELKSQDKNIGYNIASGGNPGKEIGQKSLSNLWKTTEFREKMKLATRKGSRKLTDEQIGIIKTLHKDGYGVTVLCRLFDTLDTGIRGIIWNKTWKEIPAIEVTEDIRNKR